MTLHLCLAMQNIITPCVFKHIKSEKYTRVHETIFSPFDPCLTIDSQPMKFLLNFNEPDTFKEEHFKTLENVKGEFESFGELLSVRETGIGNRHSPMNCVSKM